MPISKEGVEGVGAKVPNSLYFWSNDKMSFVYQSHYIIFTPWILSYTLRSAPGREKRLVILSLPSERFNKHRNKQKQKTTKINNNIKIKNKKINKINKIITTINS